MTTAVVIPTLNRRVALLGALKSLFEQLSGGYQVIIVDSGSSDGTPEMVARQFPASILLHGNSSFWWAAATNAGIRKAKELKCSHVLTYNDDNIAAPGLFAALTEAARKHPDSIVSAVCCYLERPNTVFFAGRKRARNSARFYYLDHEAPYSRLEGDVREVDLLHGMCTLFPMTVFDTVGLFDDATFPHLFADDDLLLRAARAGYHLRVALNAVVFNDRTKTGFNPYDRRLGMLGVLRLLTSRRSAFQVAARTCFLWRHRSNLWCFCQAWLYDYARMFSLVAARWILPESVFRRLGAKWTERLQRQ